MDIPNCSGETFDKLFQMRKLKKIHLKQKDSPSDKLNGDLHKFLTDL